MKVKCVDKYGKEHLVEKDKCIPRRSVYGYYRSGNKILMTKDLEVGRWELPGGGVDADESDEETLIREIKEETGLKVKKVNKPVHSHRNYFFDLHWKEAWDSERYFYEVEIDENGEILSEGNGYDVAAARFVDLEELENLLTADMDLKVIKQLL